MNNPSKFLGNELEYITKVLNSESWSSTEGSWTGKLEKEFAAKMGMSYGHFRTLLHSRSPINKKHAEKALTLVRYQSAELFKIGNKLEEIIQQSDRQSKV